MLEITNDQKPLLGLNIIGSISQKPNVISGVKLPGRKNYPNRRKKDRESLLEI